MAKYTWNTSQLFVETDDDESAKEVVSTCEKIAKVLETDDDDDNTEAGRIKKRTIIKTMIRRILQGISCAIENNLFHL
jgi:23S rRNA C2498 (ribose-2'-O)-methylase RlmM